MNDVLPKPFTKEGLMHILDKHLGHLKKPGVQVDGMVAPQPLSATRQVMKEEESPSTAKSPATASTWGNSPNQMPGVSPVGSNVAEEYMQAAQGHPGAYGVNSMQGNMGYNTSPQMQMQARQQQQQQQQTAHRRQISDISGGDDMNHNAKRQQMYGGAPLQPQPMNPMQRPR